MNRIKEVKVYPSNIVGNGYGFAVVVDPLPSTEYGKYLIAQKIRYALEGLNLEEDI